MADLDVTKKLHVYHLLYRINLSFAAIVRRCQGLQKTGIFRRKYLQRFQGFTQELQAEINAELVGTLNDRELNDWRRYGKVRQAWEKWLRDPDDVLVEAKRRRQQLQKQRRKSGAKP